MKNKEAYNSFKKSFNEIKQAFPNLNFNPDNKEYIEGEDVMYRGVNGNGYSIIIHYNSYRPRVHVRVYEEKDAKSVETILKKNFPKVQIFNDNPQWHRWNINAYLN